MSISVPKEIKAGEHRVALMSAIAHQLAAGRSGAAKVAGA